MVVSGQGGTTPPSSARDAQYASWRLTNENIGATFLRHNIHIWRLDDAACRREMQSGLLPD